LAVALKDAIAEDGAIWAGWSGEISNEAALRAPSARRYENIEFRETALSEEEHQAFYLGAANSVLWPTLHCRVDLALNAPGHADVYRAVNRRYAELIAPVVGSDTTVWAHDYHLMLLAEELRALGADAPLGFFLHVPFPAPEIFATIPWHLGLARGLAHFDLVGFQTETDKDNFLLFLKRYCDAEIAGDGEARAFGRRLRAGAFPISIDAREFATLADSPAADAAADMVRPSNGRRLVIGVDRMDYSKGIPERLLAIENFLGAHPEGAVQFVQIAPHSRAEIEAYAGLSAQVDGLIGRINGAHAQLDWTPVRYLAQNVEREELAGIFRLARAALVTPLRDGMNLVAKEYVAAQNADDPGVLILSRFAGAAAELKDALLVNPHDIGEVAGAIERALSMPLAERKARHRALLAVILEHDATRWAKSFLSALELARRERKVSSFRIAHGL
jgi:trehalose 6-phosphate synthase